MKQKIHINDKGELLLIEVPDGSDFAENFQDGSGTGSYDHKAYQAALTSAIEKGIRFQDTQEQKILLLEAIPVCGVMGVNSELNLIGFNFHSGTFDLPTGYTVEVKEQWRHNPNAPWHDYAFAETPVRHAEERKVALLIPHSKNEGVIQTPFCVTGESGNEAKKGDGKHYATLGDADLTVKVLQWFIDNYSPVKMNAHDLYQIYLKTNFK